MNSKGKLNLLIFSEIIYFKEKDEEILSAFYKEDKNKNYPKEESNFKGLNIRFNLLKC